MRDARDKCGAVRMWMCPAAQFISVFLQVKRDPSKSVCPYQIDLIAGFHLPESEARGGTSGGSSCVVSRRVRSSRGASEFFERVDSA